MKNIGSSNIELRISNWLFDIQNHALKVSLISKTSYAVIFWMPRKGFEHNHMKNCYSPMITKLNLENHISKIELNSEFEYRISN